MTSDPEPRRLTAEEASVMAALLACRVREHSADLRFLLELEHARAIGIALMNPARRAYLWRIAVRYRDRLPPEIQIISDGLREDLERRSQG